METGGWRRAARAAAVMLLLPGCLAGVAGEPQLVSKAEERKVGERVVDEVRKQFTLVDDPYVSDYLEQMGDRLARAMGAGEFEMSFQVVADPRINAFAVPGGHIFLTSQTILACGDPDELAGVVAHEMGHVEGRHIAHRMQKATKVNLAAMAAILAGAFLGSPEAGAAISTFGVAGAQAKMLQYSRADEEDADRRSIRALQKAGYDPWGLVRFMETLRRQSPAPEGVPAYLFTHPLPANRAAYLADALPPASEGASVAEVGALWRNQARVLAEDPRAWGVELFQERVRKHPGSCDARLGLAHLLKTSGRYDRALEILQEDGCVSSGDPQIRHERAMIWVRQGRVAEALSELEALRAEAGTPLPVLQDLGWLYLEEGMGEEALAVYDDIAVRRPRWRKLAYYRGMALGKAGREAEAHAALGSYYREQRQPKLAERHYREALQKDPDPALRDRIEGDLEELRESR